MRIRKVSFLSHLEELRRRVIKSIVFFIAVTFLTCRFIPRILPVLIKPIGDVVFIDPLEAFLVNVNISIFCGLILSSPFILYQIWGFAALGLRKKERRYVLTYGLISLILFILGVAMGYFLILPLGIKFMLGFAQSNIKPMISISRYIGFAAGITFSFGMAFQLPIAIFFLSSSGIVSPQVLSARRREIIVAIFIIAAFLTPPDVFTQILLGLPLLILYEVSIFLARIGVRNRKR